jgi:hypothetical protein
MLRSALRELTDRVKFGESFDPGRKPPKASLNQSVCFLTYCIRFLDRQPIPWSLCIQKDLYEGAREHQNKGLHVDRWNSSYVLQTEEGVGQKGRCQGLGRWQASCHQ